MLGCLPRGTKGFPKDPVHSSPSQAHLEKGGLTLAAKVRTCHSPLELQCHLGGLGVTLGWYFANFQSLNHILYVLYKIYWM